MSELSLRALESGVGKTGDHRLLRLPIQMPDLGIDHSDLQLPEHLYALLSLFPQHLLCLRLWLYCTIV